MKITYLTTYGFGQKSIIESDLSKNKTKSLVHQDLYTLFSHVLIYDTYNWTNKNNSVNV